MLHIKQQSHERFQQTQNYKELSTTPASGSQYTFLFGDTATDAAPVPPTNPQTSIGTWSTPATNPLNPSISEFPES